MLEEVVLEFQVREHFRGETTRLRSLRGRGSQECIVAERLAKLVRRSRTAVESRKGRRLMMMPCQRTG